MADSPWLELPELDYAAREREFGAILDDALAAGPGSPARFGSDAPLWQFLRWVGRRGGFVLHGSNAPDIEEFEPRQSNDTEEFGNRRGVYASTDGVWPLFYAVTDRSRPIGLVNASVTTLSADRPVRYFFSVTASRLTEGCWREGTVYLLPSVGFELDRVREIRGERLRANQAFRPSAVTPVAKFAVTPGDFPFIADVRGHDPERIARVAVADPDGFPWIDGDGDRDRDPDPDPDAAAGG